MKKIPMTRAGLTKLQNELDQLKNIERPAVVEAIQEARAHGDLSENAEYHAAREKQAFIEGRIRDLEAKISMADVIEATQLSGDTVKFGAHVTLLDEDTDEEKVYQIVGEEEANIAQGYLSIAAPLAKAIVGKKKGESIEVRTPRGEKYYEILKIEFR